MKNLKAFSYQKVAIEKKRGILNSKKPSTHAVGPVW